jgi:hypothetical protein
MAYNLFSSCLLHSSLGEVIICILAHGIFLLAEFGFCPKMNLQLNMGLKHGGGLVFSSYTKCFEFVKNYGKGSGWS